MKDRQFSLVLGGGGIKGLAHVGVLAALEEIEVHPIEIVGSSMGSLIAAAWCAGMSVHDLKPMALEIRRRDVLRVAHRDMALKRMQSPALYRKEPLEQLIRGLLGDLTFDDLDSTLIVNTVDLNSGQQVFWGTPGLTDVCVADAVYASCALPGYLPPQEIRGRHFVDGAAVENLPVGIAATRAADLVVAVDVGSSTAVRSEIHQEGFAAVYARAIEIAIQTMRDQALTNWKQPPLLFIQPRLEHLGMFAFDSVQELVEEGYRAASEIFNDPDAIPPPSASGIFPKRPVQVRIERDRCVGCGACLLYGRPGMFALDETGKAVVREPDQVWSPVDGGIVRQCPTYAIVARERKKDEK